MIAFTNFFKKTVQVVLLAALVLAAFPVTSVLAAPPAQEGVSNEKLEKAWAAAQKKIKRLERKFDRSSALISKVQGMIDKAQANDQDVEAVQAALDAFEQALPQARTFHAAAVKIAETHAGFDVNGNVIDAVQAQNTLKEMAAQLRQVRTSLDGTGRDLRETLRAYREAHPNEDQDKKGQ